MIRSAPCRRQPATAPRPTSPAPNTTQVEPGSTLAVLIAAPIPVDSPHANGAARSGGASAGILASAIWGITVYSANVLVPMKWRIRSPSRDRRVLPSGRWPRFCCSRIARHRFVFGLRQCSHSRHCGENRVTTRSPGATLVTPSPSRSTIPHPSCPSTAGAYPDGSAPEAVYMSVWQTPQASSRTSTSPARGSSSSTSVTLSGFPNSSSTAARIFTALSSPLHRLERWRRAVVGVSRIALAASGERGGLGIERTFGGWRTGDIYQEQP